MNVVYIGLGSNVGNRSSYLTASLRLMALEVGVIVQQSSVYETESWGRTDLPKFLNQVIEVITPLSAVEVLNKILAIELQLGRKRMLKWDARTIDIDILLFNDEVCETTNLTIPHPYLAERKFVLIPLNEIAPNKLHPVLNLTIQEMLAICADDLAVIRREAVI